MAPRESRGNWSARTVALCRCPEAVPLSPWVPDPFCGSANNNLNYAIVNITSNCRQKPALLGFFDSGPSTVRSLPAYPVLGAVGLGPGFAGHGDPIYDTAGESDAGANHQCRVEAADCDGLSSDQGSE